MTSLIALSTPAAPALAMLLALAIVADVRSRRIPNGLVLAGMVLAFALHAWCTAAGHPALAGPGAAAPLAGALVGLVTLMPLYLLRACGAGDVKLMAMVGAFIGPHAALSAALATFVAGGLLSVAFMFGRGVAARTLANLHLMLIDWRERVSSGQGMALQPPLAGTAARLPYALAIAAGTGCALWWRGVAG